MQNKRIRQRRKTDPGMQDKIFFCEVNISRGKIAAAMSGDEFRRSRMAAGESLEEAFLRMERMEREVQCHA